MWINQLKQKNTAHLVENLSSSDWLHSHNRKTAQSGKIKLIFNLNTQSFYMNRRKE